jgi:hypothetical protein
MELDTIDTRRDRKEIRQIDRLDHILTGQVPDRGQFSGQGFAIDFPRKNAEYTGVVDVVHILDHTRYFGIPGWRQRIPPAGASGHKDQHQNYKDDRIEI